MGLYSIFRLFTSSLVFLSFFCFLLVGCEGKGEGAPFIYPVGDCFGHPLPEISNYVLPYPAGESYILTQSNCGLFSHSDKSKYAYDFGMDIGETVTAARAGVVISVVDHIANGSGGTRANYVAIRHSDHTVAVYAHLSPGTIPVTVGTNVAQDDIIGKSGNSGYSTGPHLHFAVFDKFPNGTTIPISFSNASPRMIGKLEPGKRYKAE